MVPKGLAAAVLATIPVQAGVVGGELIKSLTYGVVMSSIVLTSIMILLVEKTGLSALYIWFFSLDSQKISGYCQRLASISGPDLSGLQADLILYGAYATHGELREQLPRLGGHFHVVVFGGSTKHADR